MEIKELFNERKIHDVVVDSQERLKGHIDRMGSNELLPANPEHLADELSRDFLISIAELGEPITLGEPSEVEIDALGYRFRGKPVLTKGTRLTLHVPYSGPAHTFNWVPSTVRLSGNVRGRIGDDLQLYAERTDHDLAAFKGLLNRCLKEVRESLEQLRKDVAAHNALLRSRALEQIVNRREKLLADRNLAASIGFPMRRRGAEEAPTYVLPMVRKPSPPFHGTKQGKEEFAPEPAIEMAVYEHILSVCSSMASVMERSPDAFRDLEEEAIRWMFLLQLNGHYHGQATGETFNCHGKTDILIRDSANGKNLFIAECKFWKGPQSFVDSIDQLLGYSSWRDTKTAILVFNRNKNFSAVVDQIPELVKGHANFRREMPYPPETGSRFAIHHRDDPDREMMLTVLAFDVPCDSDPIEE